MEQILKAAAVNGQDLTELELEKINKQTLRPLEAWEVFVFRLAACDNQVDRDFERFTDSALEKLAPMYVGKSVLMDHAWLAGKQTARVYDAHLQQDGQVNRLILRCYMPRNEETRKTIDAIETGILRECSVGCEMGSAVCSICGADQTKTCCAHVPGREYDGQLCTMALDDPRDAYEVSLVAVPAQREAGVVKSKRYGGTEEAPCPERPPSQRGVEPPTAGTGGLNPQSAADAADSPLTKGAMPPAGGTEEHASTVWEQLKSMMRKDDT